jgi:SNF2 family DNA or RNA helicase
LWRVWADDLYKRFPSKKFEVLHGSKARRLEKLSREADFYIVNHDGVKVLRDELMRRGDIDIIIVDESAQFRNAQTDKFKALWQIAGPHTDKILWLLTGSPMPHAPTDVWAQARLVSTNLVPKYFTRFRDQVMQQINQFKWVPKKGWEQMCYSICKPSVRYIRDECIDLPPCVTEMREVEMTKEQMKAYKEMLDHYVIEMRDGQITAANEGVKLGKLMQIATGAIYDGTGNTHILDIGPKRTALMEALEECGGKAIVFVPFRHSIKSLERVLNQYRVGVVHGGVSAGKRADIFAGFQTHGTIDIILAHPGTMAHGLTLTATSTIIWWGPVSSYEIYEQAVGRITRPGQKNKQTIIQLVCSDIERRVYSRLGQKEKMQGLLLELLTTK